MDVGLRVAGTQDCSLTHCDDATALDAALVEAALDAALAEIEAEGGMHRFCAKAQAEALALLRDGDRPEVGTELRDELRQRLERELAPVAAGALMANGRNVTVRSLAGAGCRCLRACRAARCHVRCGPGGGPTRWDS